MIKAHLIMPMGGAGSRFSKNGITMPKPLIEINGKPFFYWAVESVRKYLETDITFVILRQHVNDFNLDKKIHEFYPKAKITIIEKVLPGPVFTCLEGLKFIEDDLPLIFNDCDHMFSCKSLSESIKTGSYSDGGLVTFVSNQPQFSYVKYNNDGHVIGTIEKQVVSNSAICGAYMFRNASIFKKIADIYISNCPYKECFVSGMYNIMLKKGYSVKDYNLDYHVEFGTPEEYETAKNSEYFSVLQNV